jgi:uncharacterized protein (DUF2252 family)
MALDVVRRIQSFNAGRDPERLQLKYRALRASPFAFLRGTCHLFYDRLPRGGVFKSAPPAWLCGDLHLENFGSYKGDNRLVYFDVNDFDEAVLAPASWDLVRFLTSVRVAAAGTVPAQAPDTTHTDLLCQTFVDAYADALAQGKAYWVERETAQGLVRTLLDGLRNRLRPAFLDGRTLLRRGQRRLRIDGRKALAATDAQRSDVTRLLHEFAKSQQDPAFYTVLDVARRIAGTGSLGVDRYVVLVQGKGSPDHNYLLDLKQALPSSLLPRLKTVQPAWATEAERVVTLQRRLQAVSMAFLQPVLLGGQSYVLRALQPVEDRIAIASALKTPSALTAAVGTMGRLVAWSQLRSAGRQGSATADELVDFGQRRKWRRQLLDASHDSAAQVLQDAATYNVAWDDGAFGGN